jgi:hypothetical protein
VLSETGNACKSTDHYGLLIRSFRTGAQDRAAVEAIVDDLVGTGMRLPVSTGAELFAWAYEAGILP